MILPLVSSAQVQLNQYDALNLRVIQSADTYGIGDVKASINAKIGVAAEDYCHNGNFIQYQLDLSKVPSSAYPLDLKFIIFKYQDSKYAFHDYEVVGSNLVYTFNDKEFFMTINSPQQLLTFKMYYKARMLTGCYDPTDLSSNGFPLLSIFNSNSVRIYNSKADVEGYRNGNFYIFDLKPNLCQFTDFQDFINQVSPTLSCTNSSEPSALIFTPNEISSHTFTMNASKSMKKQKIALGANTSLLIPTGKTLRLEDTYIFACENEMWNSIIVENGATLILKNCLIEDGLKGIQVEPGGKLISTGTEYMSNYVSISLESDNETSNPIDLIHFNDNAFFSTYPSNYNPSVAYPRYTYFYLVPSSSNFEQPLKFAYAGINIKNVSTDIGVKDSVAQYPNYFINLANGVVIDNSKVIIKNIVAKNIPKNIEENYTHSGNGVYSNSSFLFVHGGNLYDSNNPVYDNNFTNCNIGINVNKAKNSLIFYNTIEACNKGIYIHQQSNNGNTVSEELEPTLPSIHLYSAIGENHITNCNNAITIESLMDSYYNISRKVYVDKNTISSNEPNATGIVSDALLSSITENVISLNSRFTNSIDEAAIRINTKTAFLPHVLFPKPGDPQQFYEKIGGTEIVNNDIELASGINGIVATGGRSNKIILNDIRLTDDYVDNKNKSLITVSGGSYMINRNKLNINNNSTYEAHQVKNGIRIENAPFSLLQCNEIESAFQRSGIHVLNENGATHIQGNKFEGGYSSTQGSFYDIEYGNENNFNAVTGEQFHHGNKFLNQHTSYAKYWYDEFNNSEYYQNSQFIHKNNIGLRPNVVDPSHNWFLNDLFSPEVQTFQCGEVGLVELRNEVYENWRDDIMQTTVYNDSLYIKRFNLEGNSGNYNFIGKLLFDTEFGSELLYEDDIINNLEFSSYDSYLSSNHIDLFLDMRIGFSSADILSYTGNPTSTSVDAYWSSQISDTVALNTHISDLDHSFSTIGGAQIQPIVNEYNMREIIENYALEGTLTSSNNAILSNLAYSCPYTDGSIVYYARYIHNLVNTPVRFDTLNLCSTNSLIQTSIEEKSTIEELEIFPNPSNGVINFDLSHKSEVIIYDTQGKTVYSQAHQAGECNINLTNRVLPGLYVLKIKTNTGNMSIGKVVITQ